jgi:GNAT superfamily N-acetyltransferase
MYLQLCLTHILENSMAISIHLFSPAYQQAVEDLVLGIQNNEFHLNITKDDQADLQDIQAWYPARGGQFWIALNEQNEVVGTIGLELLPRNNAGLRKMFLAPSVRGNRDLNLAQKLFEVLCVFAREQAVQDIWLDTPHHTSAAHRFYERNGFVQVHQSELPVEYRVPAVSVPIRFYRLSL